MVTFSMREKFQDVINQTAPLATQEYCGFFLFEGSGPIHKFLSSRTLLRFDVLQRLVTEVGIVELSVVATFCHE
jgi:hypothetical protein